ncbi:MAG: caspase family protein [Desulfobacteraceae bacterium]|nr:caspase family protein [Desulfobacteraceae bacterium]
MARKALLVGINDYQGISDLNGCINDVKNMRDILRNYFGFRNDDIRVLIDSRATKKNILTRLEWMVKNAKSGDVLVFHFAGHGSQVRDRDGDELRDRLDELICPYDMNWDGTYILDDDLDRIFNSVPNGALLEVFLDCCHSGSGTDIASSRSVDFGFENPVRLRYLPPPFDITCRYEGEENILSAPMGFKSETRSTSRHVLWAGCRDNQTSADAIIDGEPHGAFTYHFCRNLREADGNISRKELIDRIRYTIRNNSAQVPQLECDQSSFDKRPLQFPALRSADRLLFLTNPYMRGTDVQTVQEALAEQGYDIDTDGVFGPYTRVIVMKYQEKKGLLADGVVGPAVREALFG